MKRNHAYVVVAFCAIVLSGCSFPYFSKFGQSGQASPAVTSSPTTIKFPNPKKTPHYESNTPAHGQIIASVPINVVVNFNFDLAKPSNILITKDGKEYGQGETTIDTNKLTLRRNMDQTASDGVYAVNYKACWPDGSCHEGNFQFAVDKKSAQSYVDMRNQEEITITLENIAFKHQNVRVSKGTKVTWTNKDSTIHYVNTDSHPAHTYYPAQNSKALNQSDTYSLVFDAPGIYPYHCSAHADMMTASILVE